MNLTETFIQPQDTRLNVGGSINAGRIAVGTLKVGHLSPDVEVRMPLTVKQAAKRYKKALAAHAEALRIERAAEAALHMTAEKTRDAYKAVQDARAELEKAAKR